MKSYIDLSTVIDWFSIKITGLSVLISAITGNRYMIALNFIAVVLTIIYNIIRIYEAIKKRQNARDKIRNDAGGEAGAAMVPPVE